MSVGVIFVHNYSSVVSDPSEADKQISRQLKYALALADIRVLDHLIVGDEIVSFAERRLL